METPTLTGFERYVREDLTRSLRQVLMHREVGEANRRREVSETAVAAVLDDHAAAVPVDAAPDRLLPPP
ncbi:hypothetical protein [Halobellus ruber]|uniref:Uncharacterized protein n=1 Tax=Halobellus ruber TaxID=2761102 RepID=A0A7J9SLH7_9EURY|nr:hypothetical protein [Halobellus ruber]MBB6646876.1 hypothetical protein [Halobellus ruber]